jgi:hypothetical protein
MIVRLGIMVTVVVAASMGLASAGLAPSRRHEEPIMPARAEAAPSFPRPHLGPVHWALLMGASG